MPLLRDHAASRYKVLVATCLLTFGSYFCFDMPSMLEKPLTDSVISHASFAKSNPSFFYQLFYTVYAWTNMAMSLLAGWMVDRVGLKTCVFLFLSFCLVGSALFGLAFTLTSLTPDSRYILMFVGRFIFGLGGGSITIAQNSITAYWFKNKELAMAFGCTLTISRIGSVINFNLTNQIFNFFFGHAYTGHLLHNQTGMTMCVNAGHGHGHSNSTVKPKVVIDACQSALGNTFWCGSALVGLSFFAAFYWLAMNTLEDKNKEEQDLNVSLLDNISVNSGDQDNTSKNRKKKMQCSDILDMPMTYWLVVFVICAFYCIVFPYMSIAPQYLSDAKLNGDSKLSGTYASLVYLMSAAISPFLGRAVDYFGRRGYLAVLSTSLTLPVFLLLQYTNVNPALPMVLLGLSYCGCAATLWPTIQMLVDDKVVGSANGIATCVQMLGIGLCNLAVGHLMDSNKSKITGKINYNPLLLFFTVLAATAVGLTILLKCCDSVKGNKLYLGQRDKKNDGDNEDPYSNYEDDMMSPGTAVGNLLSPSAAVAGVSSRRR